MSAELIKKYYDYFNEQNFQGMLSLLSSDITHEVNESDPQVGIEAFTAFMKVMDTHYNEKVTDLCLFEAKDSSRVAAEFFIDGIYKKTAEGLPPAGNQRYRLRVGAFFEIKNQKITRVTNHYNLKQWIESVQ